jgi:hypothetical protein
MKFLFNVFILTLMLTAIQTNTSEASYCDIKSYIFFGNGMFNDQSDAITSKDILTHRLQSFGHLPNKDWAFELSYNHDEGIYSLFEVFRQRMGDRAASYWRMLGNLEIAPDWLQDAAREIASNFDLAEALVDDDLQRHVQRYQNLLLSGNRVLVVAHSQGNLYANAAYGNLAADSRNPMDAFGIVSVATPASFVAGNGPYYTLLYDMVISAVQMTVPGTLPGNITNTVSDTDWKHHSFIDSYLNGDQTGPLIVDTTLATADALAWPAPQIGSGPISVTLTWGDQPDVDLHVFEPNYSHVYYANPQGLSGFLDVDDTNGYGPEHYYVASCDQLLTGRYGIGVNYYRGSEPEVAHVQIQAGDMIRDYALPMAMAYGSFGNSRAMPVAEIEVLGDVEQGYEFKVQSSN